MARKVYYGISFTPEIIKNDVIMLKPDHIINGTIFENKLFDQYDDFYNMISFSNRTSDYDKMFGLGILAEDLLKFAQENNFPIGVKEYSDMCAKAYLSQIQKYVFFLERKKDKTYSFALNLINKKVVVLDLNKSAIGQLQELSGNSEEDYQKQMNDYLDKHYINSDSNIVINPHTLYKNIIKRVVGQDEAAFQLVATVCKNMKYGHHPNMKSNILLYGPTGCGKTELARTLADELDVPIIVEDMTSYTASGYVGDSVKKILRRLVSYCEGDIESAEKAIVVLDEIDKLASPDSRDTVNKTDVQEELLKIIEGGDFDINDSNRTNQECIINTSNITFILCGAFDKFQQASKKKHIGFGSVEEKEEEQIKVMTNEDLIKYGLMSELAGRIHVKIPIKALKTKELEEVLIKSNISCLKIYEKAFLKEDKVHIVYDDKNKFVNAVASKAETLGTGARALKTIIDEVFMYASADISKEKPNERELLISSETVNDCKAYQLTKVMKGKKNELSKGIRENNK